MAEGAGKRLTQPPDRLGIDTLLSPACEKSEKGSQQLRETLKVRDATVKKKEISLTEMGGMLSELLKGMKTRDDDTKRVNEENRRLFNELQNSLDVQKELLQSKLLEKELMCNERHDSVFKQITMLEAKQSSQ